MFSRKTAFAIVGMFCFLTGFLGHAGSRPFLNSAPQFMYDVSLPRMSNAARIQLFSQLVRDGFDISGVHHASGTVQFVVTENEIEILLKKYRLSGTRVASSLSGREDAAIDPRYLNPEKIEAEMKSLASRYKAFARLHEIGRSLENRPILALQISDFSGRQDVASRASVLFDALHHSREVMAPEVPLDIARTLLEQGARRNAQAQGILQSLQVWIVPMVNPDGSNLTWTQNNMWRKNARTVNGRVAGVDVNRNYTFDWGKCNGSSSSPSSDTYRGTAPASEPETQAIIRLADAIRPIGYLSYHAYGEIITMPYGCTGKRTPEHALIDRMAGSLAKLMPTEDGKTFRWGLTWEILYAIDGGSKDYMFSSFGAPAYTVELGQDFQPRYEKRDAILKSQRNAWAFFLNQMVTRQLTLQVVDGRKKDEPLMATVEISSILHQSEKPFRTDALGYFHKLLDPNEYEYRVTSVDGRQATGRVKMDGATAQFIQIRMP